MEKRLYITPPSLLRWRPKGERNDVLFLDLEPDFLDERTMRLDLDIVFWPIPIKRGWVQKKDFYIGSTGARVEFEATDGKVKNHTRGQILKVDYETSYTRSRHAEVKISPGVTAGDIKVEPGEITFGKDKERTFAAKFSSFERTLADVELGEDAIHWEIALPNGPVIRDYLIGNLHLYVEAFWHGNAKEGTIELRPSDVLFFDSDRRIIDSKMKALLMRFVLGRKAVNSKPLVVHFKEVI